MMMSSRVLPTFEPPNNATVASAAVPARLSERVTAASVRAEGGEPMTAQEEQRGQALLTAGAAPSQHAVTSGPDVAVQGTTARAPVRRVRDVPVALGTRHPDAPDPEQGAVDGPEHEDDRDAEAGKQHHEQRLGQGDHAEEESADQRAHGQPDEQQHPERVRAKILRRPRTRQPATLDPAAIRGELSPCPGPGAGQRRDQVSSDLSEEIVLIRGLAARHWSAAGAVAAAEPRYWLRVFPAPGRTR